MHDIASLRCANHQQREAAAQCPECARFYCRECVTEHNGRVLCSECIDKQRKQDRLPKGYFRRAIHAVLIFTGFLTAWFFFYYTGQTLLALPDSFHDGTFWKTEWLSK